MRLGYDVDIIAVDRLPLQYRRKPNDMIDPGIYYDKGVKIHRLSSLFEIKSISKPWLKGLNKKLAELHPNIVQPEALKFEELLFPPKDDKYPATKIIELLKDKNAYTRTQSLIKKRRDEFIFYWGEEMIKAMERVVNNPIYYI